MENMLLNKKQNKARFMADEKKKCDLHSTEHRLILLDTSSTAAFKIACLNKNDQLKTVILK